MTPIEKSYLMYLFLAYSAVFLAMFGFMLRLWHASRQLEQDFKALHEALNDISLDHASPNPPITIPIVINPSPPSIPGEKV
jgi:hypothetical protein